MIQPGNWKGQVMQVTLVPAKSTGTGPVPVPAQIPPDPVPDWNQNSAHSSCNNCVITTTTEISLRA